MFTDVLAFLKSLGMNPAIGRLMCFSMLFSVSSSPLCQRLMTIRIFFGEIPKPSKADKRRSRVQMDGTLVSATSKIVRDALSIDDHSEPNCEPTSAKTTSEFV